MEAAPDLQLCGLHTLGSRRIEKAFRHFGHDIADADHVLEAGLGFAVRTDKGGFIGRKAGRRDGWCSFGWRIPARASVITRRSCATGGSWAR